MSLAITIELGDAELQHFIDALRQAQEETRNMSAREITDAAGKLLVRDRAVDEPAYVTDRLDKLDHMISMLHDEGFALPPEERHRVLGCLAYFANPKDLIPDDVPVFGFLDDAIMIELCARELEHEMEAYADFVAYRNEDAALRGVDSASLKTERVEWAEARRVELLDRMRKRRGSYTGNGGMRLFSVGR